jgi:hypothetical protein
MPVGLQSPSAGDPRLARRAPTCARRTREAIVAATREHYSWDGVARSVIAAARGELDGLPRPAPDIGATG